MRLRGSGVGQLTAGSGPSVRRVGAVAVALAVLSVGAATGAVAADASQSVGSAGSGPSWTDSQGSTPSALDDPVRTRIVDGETYFVGQRLYTTAFDAGDDVDLLYENGTFVSDLVVRDGEVVVDTARYGPGDYILSGASGTRLDFEVTRQEYDVGISNRTVRNGGAAARAVVTVDSNRNGYSHVVTSPNLTAGELRTVLGEGSVEDVDGDGRSELLVGGGAPQQSFLADFEGLTPGNYTLRFAVRDTGVTDAIEVRVRIFPGGSATLAVEEDFRVQRVEGVTLRGVSTLPDGTVLSITVRNDGGQTFRRTEDVRVRDGRFRATFDFSGLPVGQAFDVVVEQGPVVRDRATGVVVRRAALTVADAAAADDGASVTVPEAYLPDGGFVVVADLEGTTLGATGYLSPGAHRNVSVPLDDPLGDGRTDLAVRIHRDTDGDETLNYQPDASRDRPYRVQGAVVRKLATVSVTPQTPTVTETATPTSAPTATPTATETATATPEETPTTTVDGADGETDGGDGAGFGPLAAVLAVVVAVAVARRRRRR